MKIVAYFRVSTQTQGADGLGIAAQQTAVRDYARTAKATIVAEFVEVESGRNNRRPKIAEALAHAKREDATLVVARLDRLSRDVGFLTTLLAGSVPLHFCDLPMVDGIAGRAMILVRAVFAEWESGIIGERIAVAYAAMKARGGERYRRMKAARTRARRAAHLSRRRTAIAYYATIRPTIQRYLDAGRSLAWVAWRLNEDRVPTATGGTWRRANVWRVMKRHSWEKKHTRN